MKLKPYPEYKDSGVPWLGQIPAHWECLPHRAIFLEVKDQGRIDEPLLSITITKGIIPQSQLLANSSKKDSSNLDKSKYKLVRPNDIAYNKMRAWQGAIGVSKYRGIVSPAYVVVRLRKINDPNYFHYLLRTPSFAKEAERWSYGITPDMWSLRPEHFKVIYSCLPKYQEQTQIARFLDWKTNQINKFIRNKRRLIELLKEQKQNIINQAVTRGLDPNVKLKPSGVEWLGDIPEHWDVRRVKSLSQVKRGASPRPIDDAKYFDDQGQYAWVRIADVTASGKYLETTTQKLSTLGRSKSVSIEPDSLFLSIAGSVGKPIIAKIKCCIHDGFVYFPNYSDNIEYLYYVFVSGRLWGGLGKLGTQLNLNTETVGAVSIGCPQKDEQEQIVRWIIEKSTSIDVAITRAEREIELMQEYRTRLISDVVTGQVDVRDIEVPEVTEEDLLTLEDNSEVVDDDLLQEEDE